MKISRDWLWLRLEISQPEVLNLIRLSATAPVTEISHVRTAHYAAYKVTLQDESCWLVRVGIIQPTDSLATDNSGFLGVSTFSPSGQRREATISHGYSSVGALVIPIHSYGEMDGFDITWTPFHFGDEVPLTARQWHSTLRSLQAYKPAAELPVFTNRAKTFTRLEDFPEEEADLFRSRYDEALERFFTVATSWSVVHGDAHAGNALSVEDQLLLFDFDTGCWAPSVWDLTHLLKRAGDGLNNGYSKEELLSLFSFTRQEVAAAEELRFIASTVAKRHNAQLEAIKFSLID